MSTFAHLRALGLSILFSQLNSIPVLLETTSFGLFLPIALYF